MHYKYALLAALTLAPLLHAADEPKWESAPRRRIHPTRGAWYLGLGGVSLGNLGTSGMGTSLAGAYAWDLDSTMVRVMLDLNTKQSAFFGSVTVSVSYYFLTQDISPYLSADFGAGVGKAEGDNLFTGKTVSGFLIGSGLGVTFFRESTVNLDVGVRYGYLLNTNGLGHPDLISVRVGLYF